MKNNKGLVLIIAVVAVLGIIIYKGFVSSEINPFNTSKARFIKLDTSGRTTANSAKLLTSENDLKRATNSHPNVNFNKHNYVYFDISYD